MKHLELAFPIVFLFSIVSLAAAEPGAAPDPAWLPGGMPEIQWKDTWDETRQANQEKWADELAAKEGNEFVRDHYLRARMCVLLDALARRYPHDADHRATAYEEIARGLASLGQTDAALGYAKRLVDEFPGDAAKAANGLRLILEVTTAHPRVAGDPWQDYACEGIFALAAAHKIAADDPAVNSARSVRADLARRRGWVGDTAGPVEKPVANVAPADSPIARLIYPRNAGLESRWQALALRTGGHGPEAVQEIFNGAGDDDGLVALDDVRQASVWTVVDGLIRSLPAAELAAVVEAQQRLARAAVEPLRQADDPQAVVALFRRLPYAASAQALLLECGERMLRRGDAQWALAAFRDVLAHSGGGQLREQAQVGLWLAMTSAAADDEDVAEAFAGVKADAVFTWLGKPATAGAIHEQVLAARQALAEGPKEPADRCLALTLPATIAWGTARIAGDMPANHPREWRFRFDTLVHPLGQLQTRGGAILVAGPKLLACYGNDLTRPAWTCSEQPPPEHIGWWPMHVAAFGTFEPWLDERGKVLYTRWGCDDSDQFLTRLAARDARTGRAIWSTVDDAAWQGLLPASDPVLVEGRLYVLAVSDDGQSLSTIFLVCLRAEDGAMLWKRSLAAVGIVLHEPRFLFYGNAVTVRQGRVYCATSAGVLAACDARDGLVQWARSYRPTPPPLSGELNLLRRQGARPAVVGNSVVFVPRDCPGLLAVDRDSGKLLWDQASAPSEAMLGQLDGAVLLRDPRHVVALDAVSGRTRWDHLVKEDILAAVLDGTTAYVATQSACIRLKARTGTLLDSRPWPQGVPLCQMTVRGDALVGFTEDSVGPGPREEPLAPQAPATAAAPRLPLENVWNLDLPQPRLYRPPDSAGSAPRLYVLSRNLLECVLATPRGAIEWRHYVPPTLLDIAWVGDAMLLVCDRRLIAIDPLHGAARWELPLPPGIVDWKVSGPYLLLRARESHDGDELLAVDVRQGKVLWRRLPSAVFERFTIFSYAAIGQEVHILAGRGGRPPRDVGDLVLRIEDGRIASFQKFLPACTAAAAQDATLYYLADRQVWRAKAGDLSAAAACGPVIEAGNRKGIRDLAISEGCLVLREWSYDSAPGFWLLKTDDPGFLLHAPAAAALVGGTVYERSAAAVEATELATGKKTHYPLPNNRASAQGGRQILDCSIDGGVLAVLSGERLRYPPSEKGELVLTLFDRATGAAAGSRPVGSIRYLKNDLKNELTPSWRSELAIAGGVVCITNAEGVHAYIASPEGRGK